MQGISCLAEELLASWEGHSWSEIETPPDADIWYSGADGSPESLAPLVWVREGPAFEPDRSAPCRRWLEWCLEKIQCRFLLPRYRQILLPFGSSYVCTLQSVIKQPKNEYRYLSVSVSNSTRTLSCSSCSRHRLPWQPHDSTAALCDNQVPAGRPHQSQPLGKHILVSDFIVRP